MNLKADGNMLWDYEIYEMFIGLQVDGNTASGYGGGVYASARMSLTGSTVAMGFGLKNTDTRQLVHYVDG